MLLLKILAKTAVLPVILIVKIASGLVYLAAHISSRITGPVLFFMGGCCIWSVCTSNWKSAAILGAACVLLYLVYLLAGVIIAALSVVSDIMLGFLVS